jgi:hypothetical protein
MSCSQRRAQNPPTVALCEYRQLERTVKRSITAGIAFPFQQIAALPWQQGLQQIIHSARSSGALHYGLHHYLSAGATEALQVFSRAAQRTDGGMGGWRARRAGRRGSRKWRRDKVHVLESKRCPVPATAGASAPSSCSRCPACAPRPAPPRPLPAAGRKCSAHAAQRAAGQAPEKPVARYPAWARGRQCS